MRGSASIGMEFDLSDVDLRPLGNRRPPIEWASTYVPQKDSKVRSGNRYGSMYGVIAWCLSDKA